MLLRGVVHVEPRVGEVVGAALRRFMKDASYAPTVLKCFIAFWFDPRNIEREGSGHRILLESARLSNLPREVEAGLAWKRRTYSSAGRGDSTRCTVPHFV